MSCTPSIFKLWSSIRENSSLQVNRVVVFHSGYFSFILNAVHCRERQSENGILKAPSTSANTFWQLEKASDSRSGKYEVSAPHNISLPLPCSRFLRYHSFLLSFMNVTFLLDKARQMDMASH